MKRPRSIEEGLEPTGRGGIRGAGTGLDGEIFRGLAGFRSLPDFSRFSAFALDDDRRSPNPCRTGTI